MWIKGSHPSVEDGNESMRGWRRLTTAKLAVIEMRLNERKKPLSYDWLKFFRNGWEEWYRPETLQMDVGGCTLGTGTTSADFQIGGR